ncbi:MAG: hypothetical protein HZA34_05030 [Candidatus Pacebacteria bacterium]|nr:hypothetical protein [Candidatus Paceibacterota bacterium]
MQKNNDAIRTAYDPILLIAPAAHHLTWLKETYMLTQFPEHPDLLWIDESPSIRIETIRDCIVWTHTKPYAHPTKTIVVVGADRMTPQAQHAFLKTLEEPPNLLQIILTTSNEYGLLDTVKSRCRMIRAWEANKTSPSSNTFVPPRTYTEAILLAEQIGKDKENAIVWCNEQIRFLRDQNINHPSSEVTKKLSHLSTALRRVKKNVNVKLALESMFFAMVQSQNAQTNPLAKPEYFV